MKNDDDQPPGPWDGVVHRSFEVTVKQADDEGRWIDVIASTTTIDAHGDIVEQDWNLDRYLSNPVVLWNHNKFGTWSYAEGTNNPEAFLPIGHSTNVRVEEGALQVRIVFGSKEYNEMSERVFLGFKEGNIRSVSVGFRPGRVTEELVEGKTRYRLGNNELMEISAVPIPSNPDAVAKSIDFERDNLGRIAARNAAEGGQETTTMTPEEKTLYEAALKDAREARDIAQKAVSGLKAEEAVTAQLEKDRDAAVAQAKSADERAAAAEATVVDAEIDKFVGKKLTPAERDDQVALAKDIGLDRVKAMLEKRADIALTAPVKDGEGNELKSTSQPAPASVDAKGDGSADLVSAALTAAN